MSTGPFTRRRLAAAIGGLHEVIESQAPGVGTGVTKAITSVTNADLFIITGRVLVTSIVGQVTTGVQTQTNNVKLTFDPAGTGADTDLCATLNVTGAAVGSLLTITGTLASAMVSGVWRALKMVTEQILQDGKIKLVASATNTGAISWTVHYIPLSDGATIVAA